MKQFIVMLFLSPLELQQFVQAGEKGVITALFKEFFSPAVTKRLIVGQWHFMGEGGYKPRRFVAEMKPELLDGLNLKGSAWGGIEDRAEPRSSPTVPSVLVLPPPTLIRRLVARPRLGPRNIDRSPPRSFFGSRRIVLARGSKGSEASGLVVEVIVFDRLLRWFRRFQRFDAVSSTESTGSLGLLGIGDGFG